MSKESLPSNYDQRIPRVSQIVSYFYPMDSDSLDRFLSWLNMKGILYDDYMKEASSGGRYVHSQLEKFIKT